MLINNLDLYVEQIQGNPGITLSSNMILKKQYTYPYPHKYFILSPIGKYFKMIGNDSILLNPAKGYFLPPFSLTTSQVDIVQISNELFKNSNPLSGKAVLALEFALKKAEKKSTNFSNRL